MSIHPDHWKDNPLRESHEDHQEAPMGLDEGSVGNATLLTYFCACFCACFHTRFHLTDRCPNMLRIFCGG